MVKPEWGTKRTCPKCGTRFYDLGKEDPATCVECGESFVPEAVLKSKQPMPFEAAPKKDAKKGKGKKKKVKDAEGGKPAVYKWDAVRQR